MVAEIEAVMRLLDAFYYGSAAIVAGRQVGGAMPHQPLSSSMEWIVLSSTRAREPLLTTAHRENLRASLEERCRGKVTAALQRQQRLHEGHVSSLKERAAGWAVLGGGLAWGGGFSLLGPAVAVMGSLAGGSSRAAGMLFQAGSWLQEQRLPTHLDTAP